MTEVTLPESFEFSHIVSASVSPSIRSTDIKLKEVQRNMPKMTDCFIKLLSQLPSILQTNGDYKNEKLEAIQTILDGLKMSGHAIENLKSIRKKILLSAIGNEFKDLTKFAEDTNSYLFWEELENSLKKTKERHFSFHALKSKKNYLHASTKRKFHETSKNDRPTKRAIRGHKGIAYYFFPSTWAEQKKQSSRRSQCKIYIHGRN